MLFDSIITQETALFLPALRNGPAENCFNWRNVFIELMTIEAEACFKSESISCTETDPFCKVDAIIFTVFKSLSERESKIFRN